MNSRDKERFEMISTIIDQYLKEYDDAVRNGFMDLAEEIGNQIYECLNRIHDSDNTINLTTEVKQ